MSGPTADPRTCVREEGGEDCPIGLCVWENNFRERITRHTCII